MLDGLAKGILIGLGAAVLIGQVNVEIARRTLRGGFLAGFSVGAGACTVDVMYAGLTTLGIGPLLRHPGVEITLAVTAVLVLTYLGSQCLLAAWRVTRADDSDIAPPPSGRAGYATGLVMTVTNPMTLAFWFFTLPGIAGPVSRSQLFPVAAGVFVGTVSWVVTFAGILSAARRFRRDLWMRFADVFGGITLIAFAVRTFLRSIYPHL